MRNKIKDTTVEMPKTKKVSRKKVVEVAPVVAEETVTTPTMTEDIFDDVEVKTGYEDKDLAILSDFAAEVTAVKPSYVVQTTCVTCGTSVVLGKLGQADGIQVIVTPGKPLELTCSKCGTHIALEVDTIKE